MTSFLAAAVLAPGAAALAQAAFGRRRSGSPTLVVPATGAAFACAGALAVLVAAGDPVTWAGLRDGGGDLIVGLRLDRIAALLLMLVLGIATLVQAFAARSLRGDVRRGGFVVLSGLLTSAAAATVTAGTLIGLAVAWTATTVLLAGLVGLYRGWDPADEGLRRTAVALTIGDVALWAAVAILTARHGSIELARIAADPPAADGWTLPAALLILVAACARSAQVPFHGWLPATLASPTPVSAMLHAGVVNAGAVLLLSLAPIVTAAPLAMHAALVVGALTAATGTALMLARPDVKGALAQSTVAQMGFMLVTCGLGAWIAAVIHLAAHGAYKAWRFLGSGGTVGRIARDRRTAAASGHAQAGAGWAGLAALFAAAPIAITAWLLDVSGSAALLLAFAWAALANAGHGWLSARRGIRGALWFAGFASIVGPLYVAVIEQATRFFAVAVPAPAAAPPSPWLLVPAAALMATPIALHAAGPAALRDRLYVWALTAGDGSRPPRRRRGHALPTLVIDSEGARS